MASQSYPLSDEATYWTVDAGQWSSEQSLTEGLSSAHWQPQTDHGLHAQMGPDAFLADFNGLPSVLSANQQRYAIPTEAEQRAVTLLKDFPAYVLARWFDLARRSPAGETPPRLVW